MSGTVKFRMAHGCSRLGQNLSQRLRIKPAAPPAYVLISTTRKAKAQRTDIDETTVETFKLIPIACRSTHWAHRCKQRVIDVQASLRQMRLLIRFVFNCKHRDLSRKKKIKKSRSDVSPVMRAWASSWNLHFLILFSSFLLHAACWRIHRRRCLNGGWLHFKLLSQAYSCYSKNINFITKQLSQPPLQIPNSASMLALDLLVSAYEHCSDPIS